jgi:hypothetical protein
MKEGMDEVLELCIYLIIESDDPDRQYLETLLKKKVNWSFNESRHDVTALKTPRPK